MGEVSLNLQNMSKKQTAVNSVKKSKPTILESQGHYSEMQTK